AHKTNTCEPLIKQTTTAVMNPTETSLIDLGSINTNMATESSSETMPVPEAKTTDVSRETNSFLSNSISAAAGSTSSSEFLNTSAIGEDPKLTSNGVVYWVLGVVVIVLLVGLVAAVYCVRRFKKNSSYGTRQPKESIEAEVWSNNQTQNSSP
ncbi:hypothetical protein scyTo_0020644, partial [Scyliorhinus torazame]|nr:hypothetical protein [Scyliorhinus torazame]